MHRPNKLLCAVYRVEKKEGAYLYTQAGSVENSNGKKVAALEMLPSALVGQLGRLTEVMKLVLTAERKLANADAGKVIQAIADCGYYLQLPPVDEPVNEGKTKQS